MAYRINGFRQIERFYSIVFENELDIKPQHISLYLFLLNQNNRSNWAEWFKCPYDLAMNGACIGSKSTYYSILEDLQKWNLIKYIPGINNWKAPKISIICLYNNEQLDVPLPEQLTEQASEQLTIQLTEQLPIHKIKLLTKNIKHITNNYIDVLLDINFENRFNEIFNPEEVKGLGIEFEIFWNLYDKKIGDRKKIKSKWDKLNLIEQEKILIYIPKYIESQPDKIFRKNPETFFNNKSWNDEIIKQTNGTKINDSYHRTAQELNNTHFDYTS